MRSTFTALLTSALLLLVSCNPSTSGNSDNTRPPPDGWFVGQWSASLGDAESGLFRLDVLIDENFAGSITWWHNCTVNDIGFEENCEVLSETPIATGLLQDTDEFMIEAANATRLEPLSAAHTVRYYGLYMGQERVINMFYMKFLGPIVDYISPVFESANTLNSNPD